MAGFSSFKLAPALESDIPEIMSLLIPCFAHIPFEPLLGNVDTAPGREAAGRRHRDAWRQHARSATVPCALKCTHTRPETGEEQIVGFCEWFVYASPTSADQHAEADALMSGAWLPATSEARRTVREALEPVFALRRKWLRGRPCAILLYMCAAPAWRRQGVATMCVQWGVDRCKELGIPAYLEASEEGEPVYRRMGFVELEKAKTTVEGLEGEFPVMMWWPPGTETEARGPAAMQMDGHPT